MLPATLPPPVVTTVGRRLDRLGEGSMNGVAMHIANGIVNAQVSAVFAAVAAAALAICVWRGRADLDDRLAPMAGLVAAFIFAVQMLNFQVLPGVSGHLLGGTLAVVLVGPWVGALCVSTVLLIQCLLFADGGLTALGLNITNMAVIGTAAGYLLVAGLLRLVPKTPRGVAVTTFVASIVSVVVAARDERASAAVDESMTRSVASARTEPASAEETQRVSRGSAASVVQTCASCAGQSALVVSVASKSQQ